MNEFQWTTGRHHLNARHLHMNTVLERAVAAEPPGDLPPSMHACMNHSQYDSKNIIRSTSLAAVGVNIKVDDDRIDTNIRLHFYIIISITAA